MNDERHDLDGSTLRWFHVLLYATILCGLGALAAMAWFVLPSLL